MSLKWQHLLQVPMVTPCLWIHKDTLIKGTVGAIGWQIAFKAQKELIGDVLNIGEVAVLPEPQQKEIMF